MEWDREGKRSVYACKCVYVVIQSHIPQEKGYASGGAGGGGQMC